MPIEVMIVDDSASVRQTMTNILSATSDIHVLATAMDPIFAMEKMKKVWPDVLILDVEMPRMDGLAFLRRVMAARPTPVIICSSLTRAGTATSLEALAAGAVAVFAKSELNVAHSLDVQGAELVKAVRAAAQAQPKARSAPESFGAKNVVELPPPPQVAIGDRIVAIGISTGGPQALEAVLTRLPATCPGIVIVQHMPAEFTGAFAERLNDLCQIEVKEGVTGDRVQPGRAIIAPGGKHMSVVAVGRGLTVEVKAGPPVNRHCPSADVLFRSVAKCAARRATGIIMTGMGDDGARGLLELRQAGGDTWAQDQGSCIVFGMPKEAISMGAAAHVVSLHDVPMVIAPSLRQAA